MNVVFINPGHDTAGVGYAFKAAFDAQAPGWKARAICRNLTYLNYPKDIVWSAAIRNKPLAKKVMGLLSAADVVHAMNSYKPLGWLEPRLSQTLVVHHLGSTFRRDPEGQSAICRELGAIEVTDSVDLLLGPHVSYLPVPIDLKGMQQVRASRSDGHPSPHGQARSSQRSALVRDGSTVRIAHAPTDREYKDTAVIQKAVGSLSRRYPITFDLIEGVPNRKCLVRKAQADIFVDQLKYGFGVNAIECWAMGIPVVSGFEDQDARKRSYDMFGELPWADATAKTLEAVIEHLIVDQDWRAKLGERGRKHAERWHSQRAVVERTLDIYRGAGLEKVA